MIIHMMPKKHQRKSRSASHTFKGCAQILTPTATNASGVFVGDRLELDTSASLLWSEIAQSFQKWKINWLVFEFVPIQPITTGGYIAMSVLEDPDSTTPTNMSQMLGLRTAHWGPYFEPRFRLRYKPKHSGWLWTKDAGLSDDRWEMPGDLFFASQNFTSAVAPGFVNMRFSVSFDILTNTSVSRAVPLPVPSLDVRLDGQPHQPRAIEEPIDVHDLDEFIAWKKSRRISASRKTAVNPPS